MGIKGSEGRCMYIFIYFGGILGEWSLTQRDSGNLWKWGIVQEDLLGLKGSKKCGVSNVG